MILSRVVPVLFLAGVAFGQTTALPTATTVSTPAPPPDPKVLDDGGFSIEPIYWLNHAQPLLRGGSQATIYTNLSYIGDSGFAYGGEIGIPAGRSNTLRVSYFRVQGNGNSYVPAQGATIFSEAYDPGTYLAASFRIQSAKISWDYLSYTFKNHVRFKTLYEMQYVTISTSVVAPFLPPLTDAAGNTNTNSSTGSKNLFLPSFGGELEQSFKKNFRWELKGSGFGLPHRSVIWDAQADVALRIRSVELIAGGRAFHFKNSPNSNEYFTDTMEGAFVGLRYYFGGQQQ